MRKRSLTFRLTLLFCLASSVVLLALGTLISMSIEQHMTEQDMEVLHGKMELARSALASVHSPAQLAALPTQLDESLVGHHGLALLVLRPDGKPLFESGDARFPFDRLRLAPEGQPVIWGEGEDRYRGIAQALPTGMADTSPAFVAVATEIGHHEAFMSSIRRTLWLFVVFAAIATGLLGWFATRRSLAPLRDIRQAAAGVTASRLNQRLAVETVPVELAELAETLNQMLERLEDSFRRLSDFSSDLAHELRTPLSNLMTQTQVSLTKARSVTEYQEVLSSNAEELERLARMVSDMLFLAKADNGLVMPSAEPVKLEDEVDDLLEFYEALSEASSVKLIRAGTGTVLGDRLMLRRAFSNLLSNAIRHAAPNSSVNILIEERADGVEVAVENAGEPIPAEQLPRLFDRFFRGDASRHRTSEGAGLGLAITASILKAHGGTIAATSANGVTSVILCLPSSAMTSV